MLLVTGGAGFIGSNVVASLNEAGHSDITLNDTLGTAEKWRNLAKRQLADVVFPGELAAWLDGRKLDLVIHLGAISDTTATDGDLVLENNFRLSLSLLDWCTTTRTPFIYASSAATYGDGAQGFIDDWSPAGLQRLRPLNLYGWSKHLFAQMIANRFAKGLPLPPQWVGLKFFNVFGPNEYHKGDMMSLVAKRLDEPGAGGSFGCLHRDAIADGDQRRDFISVEDAGTGEHRIHRYATNISRQVPVFYQADVKNLRRAGYDKAFTPLEHAMGHYITGFLNRVERYR